MAERMDVFGVTKIKGDRKMYTRLGTLFVNKDGSMGGTLNAFSVSGEVYIKPHKKGEKTQGELAV